MKIAILVFRYTFRALPGSGESTIYKNYEVTYPEGGLTPDFLEQKISEVRGVWLEKAQIHNIIRLD